MPVSVLKNIRWVRQDRGTVIQDVRNRVTAIMNENNYDNRTSIVSISSILINKAGISGHKSSVSDTLVDIVVYRSQAQHTWWAKNKISRQYEKRNTKVQQMQSYVRIKPGFLNRL